jgi:hypothetical protein
MLVPHPPGDETGRLRPSGDVKHFILRAEHPLLKRRVLTSWFKWAMKNALLAAAHAWPRAL